LFYGRRVSVRQVHTYLQAGKKCYNRKEKQ
jgi:hypothetical protein